MFASLAISPSIGLSSAVPSPIFFASGRLGAGQLRRLDRVLPELRRRRLVRIIMIHHPPLPGQVDRRRGLDDAAAFAAIVARHGAELVLHGHMHRHMLAMAAGGTPVIGVTAARSFSHDADPAGYNLVTVDAGGGLSQDHRPPSHRRRQPARSSMQRHTSSSLLAAASAVGSG